MSISSEEYRFARPAGERYVGETERVAAESDSELADWDEQLENNSPMFPEVAVTQSDIETGNDTFNISSTLPESSRLNIGDTNREYVKADGTLEGHERLDTSGSPSNPVVATAINDTLNN